MQAPTTTSNLVRSSFSISSTFDRAILHLIQHGYYAPGTLIQYIPLFIRRLTLIHSACMVENTVRWLITCICGILGAKHWYLAPWRLILSNTKTASWISLPSYTPQPDRLWWKNHTPFTLLRYFVLQLWWKGGKNLWESLSESGHTLFHSFYAANKLCLFRLGSREDSPSRWGWRIRRRREWPSACFFQLIL